MKAHKESGQTIIIITVSMFVMLIMAALIVDGGNAFLNRRKAQTAADAAALAGAYEYCVNHGDADSIEAIITQYAVAENHASIVESWGLISNNQIQVSVAVTNSTFFARVFGQEITTVRADASAGCFPPGAVDSVLPIAWSCRPPLPGMPTDNDVCEYKSIPWEVMEEIIADPSFDPTGNPGTLLYHDDEFEGETAEEYLNSMGENQIYLVMNSSPLIEDVNCTAPDGSEQFCDLDGDGRVDWTVSERSWLLLDPDSNQAQLDEIVCKEIEFGMQIPGWYPGRQGNIADVYKDAETCVEGSAALIPVFEEGAICGNSVDPNIDCPKYVPGDYVMRINGADPETYFRVITFAQFYVSCVSDKPSKKCPGKQAAMDYMEEHYGAKVAAGYSNEFSIEGYFVTGWVADSSTAGMGDNSIDLGVYVISLTE